MRDLEPTIRSRELGLALHRAAEAKGLSGSDIARQLGWSPSRISRISSGKRGSHNREDIIAILAVCGITGPKRDELLEHCGRAYEEGWWQQHGDRLPPELRTLSDYEDAAIAITNFETTLVPGLLQTPAYMRAPIATTPAIPPEEIDLRIQARRKRQRIFDRSNPARFVFFLDEYVLLRTGPGQETMSEQLHHLLRMAIRPHIQIRIVPDAVGLHAGQMSFKLMRFTEIRPVLHIENQTSVLFLERKDTIAGYSRIVDHLSTVALDERRSRETLAILAKALGAPREDYDDPAPPLEEEFPHSPQ
jgi:transcriptional regulator with XRE-family HTH domain